MPGPKPRAATKTLGFTQKLGLLLAIVLVAIGVGLTYFYFEAIVRHSLNYIWDTLLNTDSRRILVVPTCVVLSLVFFWLQHRFDPRSESHESQGLGEVPAPTVTNFIKVLGLGFFSLLAGASLGPEAILVPACMIIGGYVGVSLFKKEAFVPQLLGMVGFIALIAAFFNSFVAGMLGLLLVTKQVKIKLNAGLVLIAALASAVTVYALKVLSSSAYTKLPHANWKVSLSSLVVLIVLSIGGYALTYALSTVSKRFEIISQIIAKRSWWARGLVASIGLSALYLLGGSLVEFTGNESVIPMLQRASSLGAAGLLWILIIKLSAISWSKTLGYRGGLVFPTLFAASVLVAIAKQYVPSFSFILGLIVVMSGVIVADRKVHILF